MTTPLLRDASPPDLVVFDVDGTLHDTFRWWAPVIRAGLRRFAEREGIEVAMPSDAEAEAVVGMRDAGVWAPFLPDAHKHRWLDLRAVVLPMEVAEISSGTDYLFAGVRELLPHLRASGVKVALASNCRSTYMGAMMAGQGLAALSDFQFCLDSPGVGSKTDMLARAREAAGAQRVVMVGDREPDHEAASAHGWPFVWRRSHRCSIASADLVWDGDPARLLAGLSLPPMTGRATL
ncbi:MAG: HAD family hydrolase [Planctomycetes bacterium]|nr:HAD family hydrolase [Planctomycetota bacterium]